MTVKRLWFWILTLLFAGMVLFWMIHVPYRPDRLFCAIPANAELISVHDGLAARWPEISRNALVMSLLGAFGMDAEDQAQLAADRDFQYWFRRLTPDRAVMAYVPSFFRLGQEAWVVTSWLGGDSQRLRWMLTWTRAHPCRREGRHHGRILWSIETGEDGPPFRFALVEGGVIGVVCEDPVALSALLDMYDGRVPNACALVASLAKQAVEKNPAVRDFGLYAPESFPLRYRFTELRADAVAGTLALPMGLAATPDWLDAGQCAELRRIIGDLPLAMLLLSRQGLRDGMEQFPAAAPAVLPWLEQLDGDALMLCVLGGDYSGRIKGIKWPAFVAGIPVGKARDARAMAQQILDSLNQQYQWGLIFREVPQGDKPSIYIIESTAGNAYSKFSVQEQFACTVRGGWLLLASNAGTLMKISARYDGPESLQQADAARWSVPRAGDAGLCWMDLAEGGKIIKLALSAYSLKLLFGDPNGTLEERQRLNGYKAWMDTLAPFEMLQARARTGSEAELDIRLGAPLAAP